MSARKVTVPPPMTSGKFPVGQGNSDSSSPGFVQREQSLTNRRVAPAPEVGRLKR